MTKRPAIKDAARVRADIVRRYKDYNDTLGYEAALSLLMNTGCSEVQADDLLHPPRPNALGPHYPAPGYWED